MIPVSSNHSISEQSRNLLALTMIPGLGPVRIDRLISVAGSPSAALTMTKSQLLRVEGIGPQTATQIIERRSHVFEQVDKELDALAQVDGSVVTILDQHYPAILKKAPDAPPVLQYKGNLDSLNNPIAMVGSRRCTIYGTEQATRFATSLGSAGFTVVSGGARGIDSAAHRGALDAGGKTLVVQGCGLGHVYPKENKDLFDRVVGSGGAVISELPFNTPPSSENFPARNRIISGLSLGVLVIEAGRRSGALITARHAVEDHGREVFAIPGRVDSSASAGSNDLLKSGAHLVSEPSEIIEILQRGSGHLLRSMNKSSRSSSGSRPEPIGAVDPVGQQILDALDEPRTSDQLVEMLRMTPAEVRAAATMLEIQGRIKRAGSRFERSF